MRSPCLMKFKNGMFTGLNTSILWPTQSTNSQDNNWIFTIDVRYIRGKSKRWTALDFSF